MATAAIRVSTLPSRAEFVRQARAIGSRYDGTIHWAEDGSTVLTNVAFGGLVGWVNNTFFFSRHRSFLFDAGLTEAQFCDQVYS